MLTKINLCQQVQTFLMFYFVCKFVQCRQMLSKLSILVVTFGITEHNKEVLAGQYEHVVYFWSFSFQESRRRFAKIFKSCSAQVLCTVGQKGYSFIYILELNTHFQDIIHCKCLQGFTGYLRGNRSVGISNLRGLKVYP